MVDNWEFHNIGNDISFVSQKMVTSDVTTFTIYNTPNISAYWE